MSVTQRIRDDSLFSIIVGPMVWAVHFLIIYPFTAVACAKDFFDTRWLGFTVVHWVVGVATVIAAGLILDGGLTAWRRWRGRAPDQPPAPQPPHEKPDRDSRRRFMAYAGLLLCGISLIAVIWESLPVWLMDSCR